MNKWTNVRKFCVRLQLWVWTTIHTYSHTNVFQHQWLCQCDLEWRITEYVVLHMPKVFKDLELFLQFGVWHAKRHMARLQRKFEISDRFRMWCLNYMRVKGVRQSLKTQNNRVKLYQNKTSEKTTNALHCHCSVDVPLCVRIKTKLKAWHTPRPCKLSTVQSTATLNDFFINIRYECAAQ